MKLMFLLFTICLALISPAQQLYEMPKAVESCPNGIKRNRSKANKTVKDSIFELIQSGKRKFKIQSEGTVQPG